MRNVSTRDEPEVHPEVAHTEVSQFTRVPGPDHKLVDTKTRNLGPSDSILRVSLPFWID